ncbi:glutamate receptor 2.7-like [Argentina anserina]|uniref:glutamate receptor 2.7-like n=1 Tax=Argentina anserina TaxID=57926 RepID=UPI0021766927|nr:glutamate receptor 2.7-like [Potentilla anserina]
MSYSTAKTPQRLEVLFPLLIIYLLFYLPNTVEAEDEKYVTNIGAIIDFNSRFGKEQKAAMEIAAENFNNLSETHELIIHFQDSVRDPFRAAYAAEHLVKEEKVQVIVGMETWPAAVTVADVVKNLSGNQVPVISFAAPTIKPPLIQRRWPFLIRMGSDGAAQMACIGDIVSAYYWKRVVVIYEDDGYGGGVGRLALLSEILRNIGAKIEHRIVLPRLSESDPYWNEVEKLFELSNVTSRAFIVLQSSLPTLNGLFKVAKKMGLVGEDSAWIISESITSLLDSQGNHDMDGTLGIKTYSNTTATFQKDLRTKYSEDDYSEPGIYALRAYDIISIITQAVSAMPIKSTSTSFQELLAAKLRNFEGLSGKMQLKEGEVLLDSPRFRIINIVDGKTDKELNFWTPGFGFSNTLDEVFATNRSSDDVGKVTWPGNLTSLRPSKGWAMPTAQKPMKILLPVHHSNFVRPIAQKNSGQMKKEGKCSVASVYEGLSIELFCIVLDKLNYSLPHEFKETNDTYSDMVELVSNKTYDAVIGDMTVIATRIGKVDFTQPYLESGLSLIVPEKSNESTWLFIKPFTWQMWVATCGILVYTILIIWFLEGLSTSNPEFEGPLLNQIATATWFAFSSLFFAHREKVSSNLTRIVFLVWLSVVLILNSSYTANLSSMLTIQRLSPGITDIEMLRSSNSFVGCDRDSFVRNYLETVLNFNSSNIKEVESNLSPKDFSKDNVTLSAVFLELPYADIFMNEHCDGYTNTKATYNFGGFSFAFQKGSPIARDFSKVFLQLLQNGTVMNLHYKWLNSNPNKCQINATSTSNTLPESLKLESFWGIFVISGATSALGFLYFAILKKFQHQATASGTL